MSENVQTVFNMNEFIQEEKNNDKKTDQELIRRLPAFEIVGKHDEKEKPISKSKYKAFKDFIQSKSS